MNPKEITAKSTVDEVCEYIRNLKLSEHSFQDIDIHFHNGFIDGKGFLVLKKNDLNNLGLIQFARRNAFYKHMLEIQETTKCRRNTDSISWETNLIDECIIGTGSMCPESPISLRKRHLDLETDEVSSEMTSDASEWEPPKRLFSPKHEKKNTDSRELPTESCYFRCKQVSKTLLKFTGVLHSAENGKITVLMNRASKHKFNEVAIKCSLHLSGSVSMSLNNLVINEESDNEEEEKHPVLSLAKCQLDSVEQTFGTSLNIQHAELNGWRVGKAYYHASSFCVFTYDFSLNQMSDVSAMVVRGVVNNVNHNGLMWITSSLKVDATTNGHSAVRCLELQDNRKYQFKDSKVSYLYLDSRCPVQNLKKGDAVITCLKLAQHPAATTSNTKIRKMYIQTWNAKANSNPQLIL
eukprot:233774_1